MINTFLTAEKNESLNILITGFVVVFAVLIMLIAIIKLYSSIVSALSGKAKKVKEKKVKVKVGDKTVTVSPEVPDARTMAVISAAVCSATEPDYQTIAVIAAAVDAVCGVGASRRIVSIRQSSPARGEWSAAGLSDKLNSRRGF